jgi:AraC-like DNA-binding protein
MRFYTRVPAAPLSDFVSDLWLYEDYKPSCHMKERILPNGTIVLVINLQDDQLRIYDAQQIECRRFSGAVVSGAYRRCFVTDTAEEKAVMGVQFKPAGAFPFLGVPPDEFAGLHLDLESLWGRAARELRERLCETTTPRKRFRLLEDALSTHLCRRLENHYAVRAALDAFGHAGGRPMVREIAKDLGLSERRLIRVFATEVGLTPKLFGRVQRFQRVVEKASQSHTDLDWTRLSLSSGYCDQSHLINDFVEFSGLTPTEYAQTLRFLDQYGVLRKRNHVPLI